MGLIITVTPCFPCDNISVKGLDTAMGLLYHDPVAKKRRKVCGVIVLASRVGRNKKKKISFGMTAAAEKLGLAGSG
jgi:hypothetical protein